jgi:hypothetical protein
MNKIYRTLQGRQIDMDKLRNKNELMPAVGNMKVNARGDELGPGGKILRTREQIMAQYYENNPNAAPDPDQKTTAKATAPSQTYVPPTETLKVEDTKVSDVVKDVEPVKEAVVPVEQKEAEVVEKATEAVQKARAKRRGIADATGE